MVIMMVMVIIPVIHIRDEYFRIPISCSFMNYYDVDEVW